VVQLTPTTGVQTVGVTGHASTDHMVTGVMSFKGVAQTSTFNTTKTASGDSLDADADSIASAAGEFVAYCGSSRDDTVTVSADSTSPVSTEWYETSKGTGDGTGLVGFGYTEDGAVTSINMRVDITAGVSKQWARGGSLDATGSHYTSPNCSNLLSIGRC
jgi:hypothetical protein